MATVLVVDDEADIRLFVRMNLELDGHRVLAAADGAEALRMIDAERPDLVVLDVLLPEMDGWAVLERVKASAERDVKEIPVLMLTALDGDEDQVRGGIEGAVRYLPKPVSPADLREAVEGALAGEPEPVQRKRAQHGALERLARLEKGSEASARAIDEPPRPRLGRLEHAPAPASDTRAPLDPARLAGLTRRQVELLDAVSSTSSVTAAADALGMSRSNVYASLRRIGRRISVGSVTELLERARDGEFSEKGVPEET
jgi:CheY-like chemotaxis protein/DNA-binding CsgD family transcriptional regulator